MSGDESFYVVLPSNSSMNYYPDNKLNHYVTKLAQSRTLLGSWECGLVEIQFPISWYNLTDDESQLEFAYYNEDNRQMVNANVSPPVGHYETPDLLARQINESIESVETTAMTVRFHYNTVSRKMTVKFSRETLGKASLIMSKSMAELLGFEWELSNVASTRRPSTHTNVLDLGDDNEPERNATIMLQERHDGKVVLIPVKSYSYTGTNVCDMQREFYSMYVYCDVVEHSAVGDAMAPLLRPVNVAGKEGTMVNKIFEPVQYIPVGRKVFETLEVYITDDLGRPIKFQRGRVIVTLHFRMKRPPYF